jgi:hypothetical protein
MYGDLASNDAQRKDKIKPRCHFVPFPERKDRHRHERRFRALANNDLGDFFVSD